MMGGRKPVSTFSASRSGAAKPLQKRNEVDKIEASSRCLRGRVDWQRLPDALNEGKSTSDCNAARERGRHGIGTVLGQTVNNAFAARGNRAGVVAGTFQSFTVPSGQTDGPQIMNNAGDTGAVKSGGTITTPDFAGSAVEMYGANQKLINDGTVETTGDNSSTVYTEGSRATITNNGAMLATGANSTVVFSFGDSSVIVNNGSVSATNDADAGIGSLGQDSRVTNNGAINVAGNTAAGILTVGDRTIVTNGGTIVTQGDYSLGAVIEGAGTKLTNDGSIRTTGDASIAIVSTGENATATNNGTIRTDGGASTGMFLTGNGSVGKNTGTINATGIAAFGILVGSETTPGDGPGNVSITNTGSIRTAGEGSFGILVDGDDAHIRNDGSIDVAGDGSTGIFLYGVNTKIANGGSISVSGAASVGVDMGPLAGATLANSGTIKVSGGAFAGVLSVGNSATVTNSGTILNSTGGNAILFNGSNATLNLLAGTRIQGAITFGGADNTVSFGSRMNAVMTFSDLPETIRAAGRPFAVNGNTVAVLDTAGFGVADDVVADLTGDIAGAVEDRITMARRERFGQAVDGLRGSHGIGAGDAAAVSVGATPVFWTTAIGGYRKQDGSGDDIGFRNSLGGVVFGVDTVLSDQWLGGAFLGAAGGSVRLDGSNQDIDNSSFFGGGYLGYVAGLNFADLSLSIGSLRQDIDRRIANNMAEGGFETAHAKSDGTFVSPALTLGTHAVWGETIVIPTLRLRYAGLFLDGYSENGGSDGLRVGSRDVHVFEARGQIAVPLAPHASENGIWATTLRAGIDGIAQSGGRVSATLLGQDIAFTPEGDRGAVRGFAGADFVFVTDGRLQLQGTIEAGYGSDRAFTAVARAGLNIPF